MQETIVRDVRSDTKARSRAKALGIHRVPAVVVNGKVAEPECAQPINPLVVRLLVGAHVEGNSGPQGRSVSEDGGTSQEGS